MANPYFMSARGETLSPLFSPSRTAHPPVMPIFLATASLFFVAFCGLVSFWISLEHQPITMTAWYSMAGWIVLPDVLLTVLIFRSIMKHNRLSPGLTAATIGTAVIGIAALVDTVFIRPDGYGTVSFVLVPFVQMVVWLGFYKLLKFFSAEF